MAFQRGLIKITSNLELTILTIPYSISNARIATVIVTMLHRSNWIWMYKNRWNPLLSESFHNFPLPFIDLGFFLEVNLVIAQIAVPYWVCELSSKGKPINHQKVLTDTRFYRKAMGRLHFVWWDAWWAHRWLFEYLFQVSR